MRCLAWKTNNSQFRKYDDVFNDAVNTPYRTIIANVTSRRIIIPEIVGRIDHARQRWFKSTESRSQNALCIVSEIRSTIYFEIAQIYKYKSRSTVKIYGTLELVEHVMERE